MKPSLLTIFLVAPLFLSAQQQIAPIPKNIAQVKLASIEALEDAGIDIPTGPIGINLAVDSEGRVTRVAFYTELETSQKQTLSESFSQLEFFPARKKGEAVKGRKDLTIILKPVSAPEEVQPLVLEEDDIPPPPPFPGNFEEDDQDGFVDLLAGSYRFPPVLFRRDMNDFPAADLESKPVFLNLRVLKLQHQGAFPGRTRRPIMLNVLVGENGYVSEFEIKREQERHFEIGQEWIDQMQFVPAMREGEPVAVWVTVPFFVP